MFNRPRNWKWMIPGILMVVCAVGGAWLWSEKNDWGAALVFGIGVVFGLGMLINGWAYIQDRAAISYVAIRKAQNQTPETIIFEMARTMHPDAVAALLAHRRMLWRIRYVPVGDLVDWVLDEAPSVHVGFVQFVLEHSSETSLMAKSMLSEGSKQFDPDGRVQDYDQYDSLLLLLQHKGICTAAFGNQPPKWIAPWEPELVRHRLGLDVDFKEKQVEGTELMRSVERARARELPPIRVNGQYS